MKHLTEDQLTKDGEIQVLRQNLTKLKAEVSHLHQERLQVVEQNKLQISEIKKQLMKEVYIALIIICVCCMKDRL